MAFDDLFRAPAPSIKDAARRDWRWYAPAWLFPFVALLAWHVWHTTTELVVSPVAMVFIWLYQFAAFFLAASLRFIGRATTRQVVVLGILVPFVIWVIAVLVRGAILAMLGRLDLS